MAKSKSNDKKKKLTEQQEFEIMKLVLDKALWIGFIVIGYGMYLLVTDFWNLWVSATAYMIVGIILLILFMVIIIKEYEIIK